MDALSSSLDASEVHFVIDSITVACVQQGADVSMQAWLLNQQLLEILLNSVSVEDASLNGLISKELLQRLAGASSVTMGRMSEGFFVATKSLKNNAGKKDTTEGDLISTDVQQIPRTTETRVKQFDDGIRLPTLQSRRCHRNLAPLVFV